MCCSLCRFAEAEQQLFSQERWGASMDEIERFVTLCRQQVQPILWLEHSFLYPTSVEDPLQYVATLTDRMGVMARMVDLLARTYTENRWDVETAPLRTQIPCLLYRAIAEYGLLHNKYLPRIQEYAYQHANELRPVHLYHAIDRAAAKIARRVEDLGIPTIISYVGESKSLLFQYQKEEGHLVGRVMHLDEQLC